MTDDMRHLVRLGVPGVISGGVTQINIAIGTVIASLEPGAVSQLYYADRVYELPLSIVGIAVGIVLLPDVARQLRAGNTAGVMDSQNRSLEFALLLTIPAALALAVIPYDIVRVLFERGAFKPADTAATAAVLAMFALGVPAFVMIKVFSPAYFAREDTTTPMRYAVDQPDGEYDRLHRSVLSTARTRDDAAARHRHRDDARRLAQCVSAVVDASANATISSPMPGCGAMCR